MLCLLMLVNLVFGVGIIPLSVVAHMFLYKICVSYCFFSDFFSQMLTFKSVCMLTNHFRRKRDSF